MSGYAGIISTDNAPPDPDLLARMAAQLAFRGPDATHVTTQPGAGFVFTFLRTGPAPQSSQQPCTLDGRTWLIGDVRLDGRRDLIETLTQHGEECQQDATDEEIILHAWRLWREGLRRIFFDQVQGDLSFGVWESGRQELHCFRDAMGGKPFYYCAGQSVFSFSNTLEALRVAPGFTQELDKEYIGDFLLVSWCPRPSHTVYRSIRRLPAGHWLTLSPRGLQINRFQGLPVEAPLFLRRPEEYVEIYRDLLEKAVSDRLPADSTAIFLSGGMDSTTVAATVCLLREKSGMDKNLHAISGDLQPLFADEEGSFANKAAAHLGLSFELAHCGALLPFTKFNDSAARFPEPLADPYWETYVHTCGQAAAKGRVVLTGYGGDNVLNNETWPYFVYLANHGRLAKALVEFGGYAITRRKVPPLRAGIRAWIRRCAGMAEPELQFPRWLAPDFERLDCLKARWDELKQKPQAVHPIHPYGYFTLTDAFWPYLQDKEEPGRTGLPLDRRSPLLDVRLLRFLLRLPSMPWCANKEIMRQAMKGLLPQSILRRPKTPVTQDVLGLQLRNRTWNPTEEQPLADAASCFIDWPHLKKRLQNAERATYAELWSYIPPLALNYWLNRVEKLRDNQLQLPKENGT
jgi:asparagine synthase (glutamine-hydrolysing)